MTIEVWPRPGRQTSADGRVKHNSHIEDGRHIIQNWLLYDFNIDGNILKPLHLEILNDFVVPTLRSTASHVVLKGRASASGDYNYNLQLSKSRVLQVKKFLLSAGFSESQAPGSQMTAYGEQYSDQVNQENALDRSVHVIIKSGLKSRGIHIDLIEDHFQVFPNNHIIYWPPPPANVPEPAVSWSIYYYQGRSVELQLYGSAEKTRHDFLLKDHANNEIFSCRYVTNSIGLGKGISASGFYIESGEAWKTFKTAVPRKIGDFEGAVKWTIGTGNQTIDFDGKEIVTVPSGGVWGPLPLNPHSSGSNDCKKL